jgi:hypothetical protein
MQLRSRPAALSERRAVYAPDPTHLAQLALRDAEKVLALRPTWHKGHSRQVGVRGEEGGVTRPVRAGAACVGRSPRGRLVPARGCVSPRNGGAAGF